MSRNITDYINCRYKIGFVNVIALQTGFMFLLKNLIIALFGSFLPTREMNDAQFSHSRQPEITYNPMTMAHYSLMSDMIHKLLMNYNKLVWYILFQ